MGLGLSLQTVFEVARITVPTFAESMLRGIDPEQADERLLAFGQRVVERADMRLEVVGREGVSADRSYVFMSNHQSHIDIPVLYATVPVRRLRMVAKKELFDVPVFGRAMRVAGFVEIDRQNREQAVDSLRRAGEQIAAGTSVWIAPEGSRSRDGYVGPLKKGGFHLARETGTPIVPVAISGTYRVLPPRAKGMRRGVQVRVVYGAPIEVEGREIPELMSEVRSFFDDNVDRWLTRGARA